MGLDAKQSLIANVWLKEMEHLRDSCSRGTEDQAERLVRKAFHLRMLSPAPLGRILPLTISENELEGLLDNGDVETAARALVGREWTIAIAPSPINGRVVARLSGPKAGVLEAAANCSAMAIIGAWTQLLTGAPTAYADTSLPDERLRRTA